MFFYHISYRMIKVVWHAVYEPASNWRLEVLVFYTLVVSKGDKSMDRSFKNGENKIKKIKLFPTSKCSKFPIVKNRNMKRFNLSLSREANVANRSM